MKTEIKAPDVGKKVVDAQVSKRTLAEKNRKKTKFASMAVKMYPPDTDAAR